VKKHYLIGALWILVVAIGTSLDSWHEKQFLPPPEQRDSATVLIDVFGEIKTVLARYLWFRMDLFHEVLDDQGVAPEKQSEVLPLLRMVTLLDPSMTDSYDQIVWDLYKGQNDFDTALKVLNEGLERNPRSYELTFRKALIYFMEDNFDAAKANASVGLLLTNDRVQLADCLRLIYRSADATDDKALQEKALKDILRLRPDDWIWLREKEKFEREYGPIEVL
jgi:tetratricopeptide (TPR) repeat protein